MKEIELLAPSGNTDCIRAAIVSGADAIYLGGSRFSARAYAENISDEDLESAIDYCHKNNTKVYITINTLIKQNEMEEAIKYAVKMNNYGADALIVQDAGLAFYLNRYYKNIELHASTQMTVHNLDGAKYMSEKGFSRIVLARETDLNQIKNISKEIETEIFIHGALCFCYSGSCLMSSIIGGRSGNRGRCAQPCRMPYSLVTKGKTIESGYLLSPKDLCTISFIKEIMESGVSSLKIEGRMKRAEYVAGVVSSYRKAIDAVKYGKDFDEESEYKKLLKLFNREGFNKGYFFDNTENLMAYNFPKNTGTLVGKVDKSNRITLIDDLRVKDGIRTSKDEGFIVNKIFKNDEAVEEAKINDNIRLLPALYKNGDEIYKTYDESFMKDLRESFKDPYYRKIFMPLYVDFTVGKNIKISTKYGEKEFSEVGDLVEVAQKNPYSKEKLISLLSKSGNTSIKFKDITFNTFEEGYISVSGVNNIRRNLVQKLEEEMTERFKHNLSTDNININKGGIRPFNNALPNILVTVLNREQYSSAKDQKVDDIAIDVFGKKTDMFKDFKSDEVYLKVPNIIKNEFDEVCGIIREFKNIKGIITSNAGIINKFGKEIKIIGDYKLNIFNSYVHNFYEELAGYCISVELNRREILDLIPNINININANINIQMLIYGKIEMMISEHCIIDCKMNGYECTSNNFYLKDRMDKEFLICTDKYCRNHIYNTVPLDLIINKGEIKNMGINSFRMDFTDEDYNKVGDIIYRYNNNLDFKGDGKTITKGHYKRGVE